MLPDELHRRLKELVALSLTGIGGIVLLSLISYHPKDPSFFHLVADGSSKVQNWFGMVGSSIADFLIQLLGFGGLLLPCGILVAAYSIWKGVRSHDLPFRLSGFIFWIIFFPPFLAILKPQVTFRQGYIKTGGVIGSRLAEALKGQFNLPGTVIILLLMILLGFFLITAWAPSDAFQHIFSEFKKLKRKLFNLLWKLKSSRDNKKIIDKYTNNGKKSGFHITVSPTPPPDEARAYPVKPQQAQPRKAKPTTSKAPLPPTQLPLTTPESPTYTLPPLALLDKPEEAKGLPADFFVKLKRKIEEKLQEFQVHGKVGNIYPGPVATLYEFKPSPGIRINQILNLQDDLALALAAQNVRISRIPGKAVVGIEIPNPQRQLIRLRPILESPAFQRHHSLLSIALGLTLKGEPYVADLAQMPHLLIGGTTGSGKSVGLNAILMSLLFRATPQALKFILIDPKRVEFSAYKTIPHLLAPVVTNPRKAAQALAWCVGEMERRYTLLSQSGARDLESFNRQVSRDKKAEPLPYIVIIIDELADLMVVARKEVEDFIVRLAQKARAVGIHLVLATQRPDKGIVTGLIKANIPSRIAYMVTQKVNSQIILDTVGAEKLLGKGDMLHIPPGTSVPIRLHGPYVDEIEVAKVVRYVSQQQKPDFVPQIMRYPIKPSRQASSHTKEEEEDTGSFPPDLVIQAVEMLLEKGQGSISYLQRRMKIGYPRAARLLDYLESLGVVGPADGAKPREVLVDRAFLEKLKQKYEASEG